MMSRSRQEYFCKETVSGKGRNAAAVRHSFILLKIDDIIGKIKFVIY